uniref:Uncharacterized protein n=1 Tax=viral metagenome TaxID=1070528 RepID=A0A6H1ZLZ9_9ZZZZ
MTCKITVYHVYQDKHNPTEQRIETNMDYGMRYALFMALIDSGVNFKVEYVRDEP